MSSGCNSVFKKLGDILQKLIKCFSVFTVTCSHVLENDIYKTLNIMDFDLIIYINILTVQWISNSYHIGIA